MPERLYLSCLRQKEQPQIPKWAMYLPEKLQKSYILKYCPYIQKQYDDILHCRLQITKEQYFQTAWRDVAKTLLEQAKQSGVCVVCSDMAADLPQQILPFATGKKLTTLFAIEGATMALERMGKSLSQSRWVIADGKTPQTEILLSLLPETINHVAIWTDRPNAFIQWQEEMLSERGIVAEVFSSCGNPAFREADVVLSCVKDGISMVYALQKEAFLLDLAGNGHLLETLAQRRADVITTDNFFFLAEKPQQIACEAEAWAYCKNNQFRTFWHDTQIAIQAKQSLSEMGIVPVGFQIGEKRRKILKNQLQKPIFTGETIDNAVMGSI